MKHRVVVAGAVARRPGVGGHAWAFLNWLVGFRQLDYDVLFVDWIEGTEPGPPAGWRAWRWLRAVTESGGPGITAALLHPGGSLGLTRREIVAWCRTADAFINVMGYLQDPEVLAAPSRRVFVDIDPGFPQMWRDLGLHDSFTGHDHFVTVGLNVGADDCRVPACGLQWVTTPPPVAVGAWGQRPLPLGPPRFTSVCTWRGPFGPVDRGGEVFGLRAHELRRFAPLPRLAPGATFELALAVDPADHRDTALLRGCGWRLVEPRDAAGTPGRYRSYIQASTAELTAAKGMYVQARSGWFSDRSACYLASGRPVIVQDTGLAGRLPLGEGLIAFSTIDEALAAVEDVSADTERHSKAARDIAVEHFDAPKVLARLLDRLGIG